MFGIDGGEFVVLALLALFLLGPERLPGLAKQAARALHDVRRWAQRTREDIGRELGPEFENFDLADLNPRKFVQKHLLDPLEEDDEPVPAPTFGSSALASRTGDDLAADTAAKSGNARAADPVSLQKAGGIEVHQPGHTVDLDGLRTDGGVVELVGAPIGPMLTTDVFADPVAAPRPAPRAVPVVPSWSDTASSQSADPDLDVDLNLDSPFDGTDLDLGVGFDQVSTDESSSWALSYYVAPPVDLDAT